MLNILTFKLGFKMLTLVSECNVGNMESPNAFETQVETGSGHFACQDNGVSQISEQIVSTCAKTLNVYTVEF